MKVLATIVLGVSYFTLTLMILSQNSDNDSQVLAVSMKVLLVLYRPSQLCLSICIASDLLSLRPS